MVTTASATWPTVTSRMYTCSTKPPRTEFVLMRSARSRFGLSMRHFSAKMLRAPPDTSLPITTPPCPSFMEQLRMTTFSIGAARRRPSSFRPDFSAMQSSPVSNVHPSMSTSRHDSGSQPSLFGPWLLTTTSRTVTLRHSTGWISHIGELTMVTPSMSTFWHRYGWMKFGRSLEPSPNTRSATGTPRAPISMSLARAAICVASGGTAFDPFQGHQCSSLAWPSRVPFPVIAMSRCSKA